MRYLISILVAFVIGAVLGATRGLNKMKTEAIELATSMYENSMNMMLSGGTTQFDSYLDQRKNNASDFLSGQIDSFKDSAKGQAQSLIQDQIDSLFGK